MAELRKVGKREASQQQVVESLAAALQDLSGALPAAFYADTAETRADIWLLFGSVRGFCGSFNEDVIRFWQGAADGQAPLILVGERCIVYLAAMRRPVAWTAPKAGWTRRRR